MTEVNARGLANQPARHGQVMSFLSKVFELNPNGLHWGRGVMFLDVALVPLVVLLAIGKEQYLLSAVFGAAYTVVADPGGSFINRARDLAVFGLVGAAVTALAFGIAASGWGWLVLAVFAVTLVAGLAVRFGLHRFVWGTLLDLWFVIALVIGAGQHESPLTSHTWGQVVAWCGGSALWIALVLIVWLIRGREDRPQPMAELPGDNSPRQLTAPVIMFAVLRALAMAGAAAISFGAGLSHADWALIATLVAMNPSLNQTTVVAGQRALGTLIGAAAATLLLLIAASEHGLDAISIRAALSVVMIVFLLHGMAVRFWNYTAFSAAIAAGILLAIDALHPSNYSAVADRVLWTLIGVAIAVLAMLLANLLAKLSAKAPPPQQAAHPA
jgi:hypothetical protein